MFFQIHDMYCTAIRRTRACGDHMGQCTTRDDVVLDPNIVATRRASGKGPTLIVPFRRTAHHPTFECTKDLESLCFVNALHVCILFPLFYS